MDYVVIDVRTARNPKVLAAGPTAAWLWASGLMWCQENKTDGVIVYSVVPVLCPVATDLQALTELLITAGLWERHERGYLVHDYLVYQRSREELEQAAVRRSEKARAAANARWDAQRMLRALPEQSSSNAKPMLGSCLADARLMPRSDTTIKREESSDQVAVPVPAVQQLDQNKNKAKGHRGHFFCGDRLCVPHFLFEEFDRQLGGADIERARRWMQQLDERAQKSGEVIEDPIQFVREAFRRSLRAMQTYRPAIGPAVPETLDSCQHVPHCTSSRACQTLRDLAVVKEQMKHDQGDGVSAGGSTEGITAQARRSDRGGHRDAGSL